MTNAGNVGLSEITVRDNRFPGETITYVSGDADGDNILDVGETWTFEKTGIVTGTGEHENVGSVTGVYTNSAGQTQTVTASDPSNYFVGPTPGVSPPPSFVPAGSIVACGAVCTTTSTRRMFS